MHIVLISPPKENMVTTMLPEKIDKERGFNPPLGLLYLASSIIKNSDHKVTVIDSEVENLGYPELKKRIEEIKPDLVGIQALTFSLIDALKTARLIKDYSKNLPVVFGGPHVTIFPRESLMMDAVDYIVMGEGEISFKNLIDKMGHKEELKKIKGIGFKDKNELVITEEPLFIEDLNSIPMPDRRLTPYNKYYSLLSKNFPVTTMMTSRGCPYRCIYCERMGKTFRAISAEKVLDEIEDCLNLGIKEIFFHDDTFTIDKKRVFKICELIKNRNLKFDWDVRARVDTVNYELLQAMKSAGLKRISFGVESGNPIVLKNLRKGITLEQVKKTFEDSRKIKLQTLADFMIGSPGETEKDIDETIAFSKSLKADYVQFSITTPYPGTDLYRSALSKGIISSDVWKEFAINPLPGFMPPVWKEYFSREELSALTEKAYKSFYLSPRFLVKELINIRSGKELLKKIKAGLGLFK